MATCLSLVLLTGCQPGGRALVAGEGVTPGLASCLASIGRPDVAADPDAPMSEAEIAGLLACTSDRASR
ncbi:hypothetical protein MWU52_11310 [Jannaschia sp. S6380]|uniref:hypothetical protein n=1 Tax=Jannaschia sp. S6380 TaxID=2926408 RepID=UPI001FF2648A|nr:hypothetical protein [Jannaschia sp. S6380]MCK0168142.1 hypothetical protein [Jannaschia sp. S6380]